MRNELVQHSSPGRWLAIRGLRLCAVTTLAMVLSVSFAGGAQAQSFPTKTVTIVVPSTAGSSLDLIARAFAQEIARDTGQAVVIDNKPGAGNSIAAQTAAKAAPDGHTVLLGTTSQSVNPHLFKRLPYDPVKDFEPVTGLAKVPLILVVNPATVPVTSVQELIKFAKQQPPGKLTIIDSTSLIRMIGVGFEQVAGVKLTGVGYKSLAQAMPDLLSGRVDMAFADLGGVMQHVKEDKLRALGVTSLQRSAFMPDVPSLHEAGLKGFEKTAWFGIYAPAKTPAAVINRLHELFGKASSRPDVQKAYATFGAALFLTTPQELARFQLLETETWGRLAKSAAIEAE